MVGVRHIKSMECSAIRGAVTAASKNLRTLFSMVNIVTDDWISSPELTKAILEYHSVDYLQPASFEDSHYFRNARLAFRKRINGSENHS